MKRLTIAVLTCVALVALVATASAAPKTTLSDIEDEVMCPTCGTALSLSESPLAERQRAFIQRLVDQGRSKQEIKARLVEEFGPEILAAPPRSGFSLAAYLVPLAVFLVVVAVVSLAVGRRTRPSRGDTVPPGDDFEELVDSDLAGVRR